MRTPRWLAPLLLLALALGRIVASSRAGEEPPTIPIGLDAYRQWDRWPVLRIGARTYMRSTFDRAGGNEGADASHFLYREADDFHVALDVEGPGLLAFVRTNHWHGSPWHYEVDGVDHVIRESSTADPLHPVAGSVFLPEGIFPEPLAWTWATTKGADLVGVPIGFERSLRLAYSRTRYGTGYYIFQRFVPGIPLSRTIRSWDGRTPPDADVLYLVGRAGGELLAVPGTPGAAAAELGEVSGGLNLAAGASIRFLEHAGAAQVRAIRFSVPKEHAVAFGKGRLRITWDDAPTPSVDVPIALFFGAGTLYNRDGREYLVKAFPVSIRQDAERVFLTCFFPMPFLASVRMELVGPEGAAVPDVRWSVTTQPLREPWGHLAPFHATYRDHPAPEAGRDLVLLDTKGVEGHDDWTGHLVGTSWIFSHRGVLDTLEGDPRFVFDDARTPQVQGTGTEEWGGGGDYWGGRTMTLPFFGHPVGTPRREEARSDEDRIESAYRFLLADAMPFGRRAVIGLEHGGTNQSTEHYETIAYWYGRPGASLVRTDSLQVGDAASERAHGYDSPDATEPVAITSRFELGPDHVDGREVYPAHTETSRTTTGTSTFTLKIDPANVGVMLRRTFDFSFPNQRAEVEVADAMADPPDWKPAGVWFTAGSNTCLYSNPPGELDAPQTIVQTSNRRFRDDEFLLPRDLTAGREAIRVRVRFTPVDRPLYPGHPLPPRAWSEIRYDAESFVCGDR